MNNIFKIAAMFGLLTLVACGAETLVDETVDDTVQTESQSEAETTDAETTDAESTDAESESDTVNVHEN
jgi:hypothetical protein